MGVGAYYPVEGGTLSFPWGVQGKVITVTGGTGVAKPKKMKDITGPGDAGVPHFLRGNYIYAVNVTGYYTSEGSSGTTIVQKGEQGSATIDFGRGERWAGTVTVVESRWTGRWNGRQAEVSFSLLFSDSITVTAAT